MKGLIWFVTGTGTEVGKTVFAAHFAALLASQALPVAVFKPVASGSRSDARLLRQATGNRQSLDEINPWHFPEPIAPLIASRHARTPLRLEQVRSHILASSRGCSRVLVEGAGGLLSPLGEGWDSRTLLESLGAVPLVVASVQLGAVHQIRATWEALPSPSRKKAWLILMMPPRPTLVTRSSLECLKEFMPADRCLPFPHLKHPTRIFLNLRSRPVRNPLLRMAPPV